MGRLELLLWEDQPVAAKLTDVAYQVHRLPRPTAAIDASQTDSPREDANLQDAIGTAPEPLDTEQIDDHPDSPFGRLMPRATPATAPHNYVLAYFRHQNPKVRLWPALMTPSNVYAIVGPAGDGEMNLNEFLSFAAERGVEVTYGDYLDDGPDEENVLFEQGLMLQYILPGGVVHCWSAVNLDLTAWAGARARWRNRIAATADGDMDGLVRGAGCVAISASCLDWALGYLTHAMRGWDDATLNAAMARPGQIWQEFNRLADELRPLLGDDLVTLREAVQQLREERHQLVHAVWMRTPGVPGVPDSYEIWHPRTDTSRPVTAEGLMELAQRLGQTTMEVQALTTALIEQSTSGED